MGEKDMLPARVCLKGGSWFSESRLLALVEVKMKVEKLAAQSAQQAWKDEIERAINNVKRSAWDKWFRREWYRATATIARKHGRYGQWRRSKRPRRTRSSNRR